MVFTPGQPDDPHQPRPALVVSDDTRNRLTDDVIVVPAFSRGALGPTRVVLYATSGVERESILFCEEVTTIDTDFLARGPLGAVTEGTLAEVCRAIRRAIGEVLPP